MTIKSSPKVRTNAVHRWLCEQRRKAVDKGVHVFRLELSGKCSIEQVIRFFGQCPELTYHARNLISHYEIVLSKPKSA